MTPRPQPNETLRWIAEDYCDSHELPAPIQGHYVGLDAQLARHIAEVYEHALVVDHSNDPIVAESYHALLREVLAQWHVLSDWGFRLLPWTQSGQPYADSLHMAADLRENRRLFFFRGGEAHAFLDHVTETGFTGTEMFRAVHDCFGHAAEGFGFGSRGEENAWLHHSMMFSPPAQRALSTETRGQNSWVNFGPYSYLPACKRPYAIQKIDLLPEYLTDWEAALKRSLLLIRSMT